MTSEMQSTAVQSPEALPTGHGTDMATGTMVWNQPGFAGLWGLVTAKDSLMYWLRGKSFSSFALTRWIFAVYLMIAALNGFLVFNRLFYSGAGNELASYPAATALILLMVLGTTKERSQGVYFWTAWSFWIFYSLVGFANATSVSNENFRVVMQSLIKSWITVIGIPWMAFRIISPDKLPRYTKLLIFTGAFGSVMCLVQTFSPELFSYIRTAETMRGAGTWENANMAGLVLMLCIFLTRLVSWRSRWVKWMVYLVLFTGFIGTFSRGALVAFVAGELAYLIIVRNYKRMFFAGSFLLLFVSTWITLGFLAQNNTIPIESKEISNRVQALSNILTGKAAEELETGRLFLWRAGIQNVLDEGSLLVGLGHAGMIKSKGSGLSPHNEYIQYFADGGILALTAFLGFLATIVYIFWRCKDRAIRASLLSIIIGYSVFGMTGDKMFMYQMIGPFLAILVLWAHYSREYPGVEKVQRLKKSLTRNLALSNSQLARPV